MVVDFTLKDCSSDRMGYPECFNRSPARGFTGATFHLNNLWLPAFQQRLELNMIGYKQLSVDATCVNKGVNVRVFTRYREHWLCLNKIL
jgi:hypothetical protein